MLHVISITGPLSEVSAIVRQSKSAILLMSGCGLLMAVKLAYIWRINFNWDEFFYLSLIHEFARGEAWSLLQTAYVHLFRWLPQVGANEIDQLITSRIFMWGCLAATVILIARLAQRWASPVTVWIAPLVFLAASPVLRHGGSFRADSLLAPLSLGVLLLLTAPVMNRSRIATAGAFLGISAAISLKAVLLLPLFLLMLLSDPVIARAQWTEKVRLLVARVSLFGMTSLITLSLLIFLHRMSLPTAESAALQDVAVNAARKTILEVPFFPRWDYFIASLGRDWLTWLLISAGVITASLRQTRAAWLVLSLLPLLFYRNAFPYYYLVILAPAAVLAAIAVEGLMEISKKGSSGLVWLPIAVSVPIAFQAVRNLDEFRFDEQGLQRATIAAVHEIFPAPVNYIDHSGMISSFPKINLFMSSWGLENYRDIGRGFMQGAIAQYRPPLLLANAPVLQAGSAGFDSLLAEDRRLIEDFYVPYWGPIRVAGATVDLDSATSAAVLFPFPGRYRLVTDTELQIDGISYVDGAIVEIPENAAELTLEVSRAGRVVPTAQFVWAEALAPPGGFMPASAVLYSGL